MPAWEPDRILQDFKAQGSARRAVLRVRAATPSDLDALMSLERACFPPRQAFSRREYAELLRSSDAVNLVAEEAGRVLGFAGALLDPRANVANVATLNVHPDARRRGLGRRLLGLLEGRMAARGIDLCTLEVNVENVAALGLYDACGYERVERLRNYYGASYANPDAWRCAKELRRDRADRQL